MEKLLAFILFVGTFLWIFNIFSWHIESWQNFDFYLEPSAEYAVSTLQRRNHSYSWASRYWTVEERRHVPLLFNLKRTSLRSEDPNFQTYDFGNLFIMPSPGLADPFSSSDNLLVAIRTSSRKMLRWGDKIAVGIVNRKVITPLLSSQPLLTHHYNDDNDNDNGDSSYNSSTSQDPAIRMNHKYREPSIIIDPQLIVSSSDTYLMNNVQQQNEEEGLYDSDGGGPTDTDLWTQPLCIPAGKREYADARMFIRRNSRQICLVLKLHLHPMPEVVCFKDDDDFFQLQIQQQSHLRRKYSLTGQRQQQDKACPVIEFSIDLPPQHEKRRNVVPLVEKNGLHWHDERNEDILWLVDMRDEESDLHPLIFPVNLAPYSNITPNSNKTGDGISSNTSIIAEPIKMKNCAFLQGWKGSTNVIRLTPRIWITIVHKYRKFPNIPKEQNHIRRIYKNKMVMFESDYPYGLPTHSLDIGPDAADFDLFQPGDDDMWPFAFVLGLVHVGVGKSFREGEQHRFILSAGIDDLQPGLKVFDVFIPHWMLHH